jgi:hypothetical protein
MTNNTSDYEDNLAFEPQNTKDDTLTERNEKINQLKDLLKECRDYLPEFETPMDILAKIDEALR